MLARWRSSRPPPQPRVQPELRSRAVPGSATQSANGPGMLRIALVRSSSYSLAPVDSAVVGQRARGGAVGIVAILAGQLLGRIGPYLVAQKLLSPVWIVQLCQPPPC